jgi:hypothetical protein
MENMLTNSITSKKLEEKDFEIDDCSMHLNTENLVQNRLRKKSLQIKILRDDKTRLRIVDKMKDMMESKSKLERLTKVILF